MVENNKWNENGNREGYWEEGYGSLYCSHWEESNELHCGYYDNGFAVGVWRTYRGDFLSNTFIVCEPYWDVHSQHEMLEFLSDSEDIHKHYYE